MKTEELEQVLREFDCQGWGDCGLQFDINNRPFGYLYPTDIFRENCIDSEWSAKEVAKLLSEANDYVIRDDGYIDIF